MVFNKMSGTKEGAKKSAEKLKAKYGEDYFKRLGKKGGTNSSGGFSQLSHEEVVEIARKGGQGRKGWRKPREV